MIGMKELLIVLVVVLLVFGTRKLRSLGSDLGSSIKDFKKALNDGEKDGEQQDTDPQLADKRTADQQGKPQG